MAPPVFVFDAYGTLFDVHAAIARHREGAGPDSDRLSDVWRAKQLEYTWTLTPAGRYLDFWVLTERALDYALARMPSVDRALRGKLLDAYLALDAGWSPTRSRSAPPRSSSFPQIAENANYFNCICQAIRSGVTPPLMHTSQAQTLSI